MHGENASFHQFGVSGIARHARALASATAEHAALDDYGTITVCVTLFVRPLVSVTVRVTMRWLECQ
jgi:hypothetical protein